MRKKMLLVYETLYNLNYKQMQQLTDIMQKIFDYKGPEEKKKFIKD